MNHSDLKTIEFAAYIGLDWADQGILLRLLLIRSGNFMGSVHGSFHLPTCRES